MVTTLLGGLATELMAVIRRYGRMVVILLGIMLVLLIIGMFVKAPGFKAFTFCLAICLFAIAWLPAGLALRILRINRRVFPRSIRGIIAWMALFCFVGVMFPSLSSKFVVIFGTGLVLAFYAASAARFRSVGKTAPVLMGVLFCLFLWHQAAPDSYRAACRNAASYSEVFFSGRDRSSIKNEGSARATYARAIKDSINLYNAKFSADTISRMIKVGKKIDKGQLVLMANYKRETSPFNGQSFVKIIVPDKDGSFVGSVSYWVEADLVAVGSRQEMDGDLVTMKSSNRFSSGSNDSSSNSSPSNSGPTGETVSGSSGVSDGYQYESVKLGADESWTSTHFFNKGENIIYEVFGDSVLLQNGDGTTFVVIPGNKYGGPMIDSGKISFRTKFGPAQIKVYF